MLRRTLITAAGSSALSAPWPGRAQTVGAQRRLGVLLSGNNAFARRFTADTILKRLQELGWSEGGNLLVEFRSAEGNPERLPQAAQNLVQLKPDVIFVGGNAFNLDAARKATNSIPIVMAGGYADLVGAGVIQSLARPGGNVTGMAGISDTIPAKRLQLLKQSLPGLSRIAYLFEPGLAGQKTSYDLITQGTRALNLEIVRYELRTSSDYEAALQQARAAKVEAMFVSGSPLLSVTNARGLAELLIKYKFPSIAYWNYQADQGFMMGYSADARDLYVRSAAYIDKIFRGANPAVLPVEEPTRYELAINLKTAKLVGVTIPQDVLLRADRVIK